MRCKYCGHPINKTRTDSIWFGEFEWSHAQGVAFCANVDGARVSKFRSEVATPDESWEVEQLLKDYE